MVSMILDTISIRYDCILESARGNKAKRMGDERGLELLQWRQMDAVVFRLRYHLVLWVRKLVACLADVIIDQCEMKALRRASYDYGR